MKIIIFGFVIVIVSLVFVAGVFAGGFGSIVLAEPEVAVLTSIGLVDLPVGTVINSEECIETISFAETRTITTEVESIEVDEEYDICCDEQLPGPFDPCDPY